MLSSLLVGLSLTIGQSGPPVLPPERGAQLLAPIDSASVPIPVPAQAPSANGVVYPYRTPGYAPTIQPNGNDKANGDGKSNGKQNGKGNGDENGNGKEKEEPEKVYGFWRAICKTYHNAFFPPKKDDENKEEEPEPERRGLPAPWSSPPFPGTEYQGYPLIGVPKNAALDTYPLMQGIYATSWGDMVKDSGIKVYGWVTAQGNFSNAQFTNAPTSYWIKPNTFQLDQVVLRFEREADTVQTDHIDWGFRSTSMYGEDYRYTNAGGWFSSQYQLHNALYGYDPIEQYLDLYVPWVMEGMVIRVGRWVACPDIETQLAPDNYMGSHSILFTYDTYTQTGVMVTVRPQEQWLLQAAINCGDDMAPWYPGATVSGFLGCRWVAKDNNDAIYTCLNQINNAQFRHFDIDGQAAGHDNYNYIVSTWEHRINEQFITKTEAYFMWERDAELGGTPTLGPPTSYAGGGSDNPTIPGWSHAWGVLNYTMLGISKMDFITFRNEFYRDETGFRTGYAGDYTSHSIGLTHNFNEVFQVRPEIGYYRNWSEPAFDFGTKRGLLLGGFDVTLRF